MSSWSSPPLPAQLAASGQMPLVGRGRELDTLDATWAGVEQRMRQVVFIGGEPGAGKTRLTAEVARALHGRDVAVLVGTSGLDVGVPYQPFTQMLDRLLADTREGSLAHCLTDAAGELARLSTSCGPPTRPR